MTVDECNLSMIGTKVPKSRALFDSFVESSCLLPGAPFEASDNGVIVFFGRIYFRKVRRGKPDVAVVFYNDHGLNFFLDKLPTFAVGAAAQYRNEDEGWGIPVSKSADGIPELSWHVIERLVADEFDVTMCQDMLVDHAVTIPMALMWPGEGRWPVRIVPVSINTVQHPLPSISRCLKLGRSVGRAIESFEPDLKVVVIGTGGLSHQLDGERAGFINKAFDEVCMNRLGNEPEALTRYTIPQFVEQAGAQGVEFLNWMAMRGALTGKVKELHRNYHIPISNTAAATMVFENVPVAKAAGEDARRDKVAA